jgi:fatty-acyl-CoA synthase
VARSAFDFAREHAQTREAFGEMLGSKQLIWSKVADMSWRLDTAELLTYRAARLYGNDPAETEKKIKDGWLYTGDLFSRDAEGFYDFRGRVDDMIVSGGENIYPREVEEVLYRCPGVQEATVVGLPDTQWGNVVSAFIVKGSPDLTAEAVDDFCRTNGELAGFKRPRRIFFLDALPMNPSGKVLKHELVERASKDEQGT